ncbi:SSI family serine proteinase inhibitor [Actinokineospora bangkokensis]|uniref:Subtilisin inhibitor domain-containing protein n=1 Tax=Actinokineospora bangkokensis TaxID=1193682 RepID=A0A1Q9LRE7_9PSEU|nr:SSI family serine proteinase inhibitor [Actinokineospora bangkokensis]OLR94588.1 hypothetical protein BJP25_12700 [Actinokineospora bangkokensis]
MISLTLTGLVAAAAALVPTAHPAAAAPHGRLVLATDDGDRVVRVVDLRCGPDGGSHPAPAAACRALRAVDGALDALQAPAGTLCTMEMAPVRVRAVGHWGRERVDYSATFSNPCALATATGPVFALGR